MDPSGGATIVISQVQITDNTSKYAARPWITENIYSTPSHNTPNQNYYTSNRTFSIEYWQHIKQIYTQFLVQEHSSKLVNWQYQVVVAQHCIWKHILITVLVWDPKNKVRQLGFGKPIGGFLPNNASQGSYLPGLVEKGGRD